MRKLWWTKEEDALLTEMYSKLSREELSMMFNGRSWNAINLRARYQLDLSRKNIGIKLGRQRELKRIPLWTREETAYIAGIIDGEGHIGLNYKPAVEGGRKAIVTPIVKVDMTHRGIVEWLSAKWGNMKGSVTIKLKDTINHPNWHQAYASQVYGPRAYEVLRRIEPFLRVKDEEADVVMAYCEWRESLISNPTKRSFAFTSDQILVQHRYINAIHALRTKQYDELNG